MNNWKSFKIGDISDSCLGKMLDKNKNKGEFQPYLSNKAVRWGEFDLSNLSEMRFEPHEEERYGIRNGDLIVCEGGEPGRCAIWRSVVPTMKIQKALHRVRVNPGFNNEFLYYRLLLAGRDGELEKYFIGSTIKHLTGVNLKKIEFEFPPYEMQCAISKVLSNLDSKIRLNNRINAELEAMAKTIYDYWFVQFDFPSPSPLGRAGVGSPYKANGGKMVWSEELKREIPEGWVAGTLSEIANITMGQSPPGETYNEEGLGTIFFQGSTDFGLRFPSIRQYTTELGRMAKQGDILLSVRAPVGTMNIAKVDCCIGRGLAALNSKDNCIVYLHGVMNNLHQIFERRNTGGTTFGAITKDDLFSLKVVRAPREILDKFNAITKPMFDKQNVMAEENQKLTELRDWLLPMLMNGQIKIKDAEGESSFASTTEDKLAMAAEPILSYSKSKL